MSLYLYIIYVKKLDKNLLQKAFFSLPGKIQNKISKLQVSIDQNKKILSYYFLHQILAKELDKDINKIIITADRNGKPFLKDYTRYFNLSYSKKIITLATDAEPVGIDIEYIDPLEDLEDLTKYFSDQERKQLLKKDKQQQIDHFYELWTLKESYLKALGKGLKYPLDSFSLDVSKDGVILFKAIDLEYDWFFKQYDFNHQYKCAVCAKHNNFPKKPNIINIKKLLRF
jgi:4'-phosphopantetheinyl transferase